MLVLSISRSCLVLPVPVGSRLTWNRVSLSFWERCCHISPNPGREVSSSWRTPCPALALSLKDHFKYFPFLVPVELCQG